VVRDSFWHNIRKGIMILRKQLIFYACLKDERLESNLDIVKKWMFTRLSMYSKAWLIQNFSIFRILVSTFKSQGRKIAMQEAAPEDQDAKKSFKALLQRL
jgi:hypothetical protein